MSSISHAPNPPAGYDHLRTIADLYNWLKRLGLTFEDAEHVMTTTARAHDGGATVSEITRSFLDEHGISLDDEHHVRDLVAFLVMSGALARAPDSFFRYRATEPPPEPYALIVARVPLDEVELIRPYIHRGRAAWLVNEDS